MSVNDVVDKPNQKRLAEIGRMTAHFAHQIRTPLSSAILYAGHLETYAAAGGESLKWVRRIQECHASIEQQIRDLLLFAQGDTQKLFPADIQQWGIRLQEKIASLAGVPSDVLAIDNRLPSVDCNMNEEALTGAVLNLVNNALQAGAKHVNITLGQTEDNVFQIRVTDNGCGMSEEVKAQAFSPFFTGKIDGTGLGLSVVESVVKAHGGGIVLDSTPLTGCCVTIHIPGQI